jgi:hypothetical protein
MHDPRRNGHGSAAVPVAEERRVHPRYPFTAAVAAVDSRSRSMLNARTSDLSQGGCYVDAFCPFPLEAPVKLRLTSEKRAFVAQATVVYSRTGMGMGLKFTGIEDGQLLVLDRWLAELSGAAPCEFDSAEETFAAQKQEIVLKEQWYVLNEVVLALMRKGLLAPSEGKSMLQRLLDQEPQI